MQAEREFAGRHRHRIKLRDHLAHARNGSSEAFAYAVYVHAANEASGDVAAIECVLLDEFFSVLIEFPNLELRERLVQVPGTHAGDVARTSRQNEPQTAHCEF